MNLLITEPELKMQTDINEVSEIVESWLNMISTQRATAIMQEYYRDILKLTSAQMNCVLAREPTEEEAESFYQYVFNTHMKL